MPVDGIEIRYPIEDFDAYKRAVPALQWSTPVDADTGEYAFKAPIEDSNNRYRFQTISHLSNYGQLRLKVNERHKWPINERSDRSNTTIDYYLEINGSLHVNHYGHNYGQFHFSDMVEQINQIATTLKIDPCKAKIRNIETGVNLQLASTTPRTIIDNLLVCANKTFDIYEQERTGRYHNLTEYKVKIYDKGYQSSAPYSVFRFELHFCRMRKVNELGIYTLKDLEDKDKVNMLIKLLSTAWEHVLLFDRTLLGNSNLTKSEKCFLNECQYGEYWQRLNKTVSRTNVKKKRDRLKAIISQHGKDYHKEIQLQIAETWQQLFTKGVTKSQLR